MDKEIIIVEEDADRLDIFLASMLDISRSQIKRLIDGDNVLVGGKSVKCGYNLKVGDVVEIVFPPTPETTLIAQNIPIDIIYEDEDLAVINKAQGMTVHPGAGNYSGTLANALMFHFSNLSSAGGTIRPGIVHRLDKDTSGLLVVAKNDFAHTDLAVQIADKTAVRIYQALVEGVVKTDEGTIVRNIIRDKRDRKKFATAENGGRYAITYYKVLQRYAKHTLISFKLGTGRTHQIRVHCKYLGHPVVGDTVYGYNSQIFKGLNGQLLHACRLEFDHPRDGRRMSFEIPLPDYFEKILGNLASNVLQKN